MKIIELKKNAKNGRTDYLVEGTDYVFLNTIRRIIIDEVPTIAIEDVEMQKNDSALYDEMIAHRLGLIPLTTDLKSYNYKENCKCGGEGCARCTVNFTLKKKGPVVVYAEDLKSSDPKIKPVYPKTIILKLLKDQEISLLATAVIGKGKDHVKFSPGLPYFRFEPIVKILKADCEKKNECIGICPKKVFEIKSSKLSVNQKNLNTCDLCGACIDLCPECVDAKPNEKNFIFSIESWGQLKNKKIFEATVDEFDSKLDELQSLIKAK